MKNNEKASFFRAILIFFIIIETITLVSYYLENNREGNVFKHNIYKHFKINSLDYNDTNLLIERIKFNNKIQLNKLYVTNTKVFSYFKEKKRNTLLKVSIPRNTFNIQLQNHLYDISLFYVMITLVNLTIAIILAKYVITPLKENLNITDEFIKDILHDINTPISVMTMNINMLEGEIGTNKKLERIKSSIDKIIFLQNNLKGYQQDLYMNKEPLKLKSYLEEKAKYFNSMYPTISIQIIDKCNNKTLKTSKDFFDRIIENLISNACKYNKTNGSVYLYIESERIRIVDTGIGIKNPKKIFNRLYKETNRGIGLGLNIVKKMINELGMDIKVKSELGKGTEMIIYFEKK